MSEFYYQQRTSDAITWLRFPLIFLIIMLHSYSVIRLSGNHETYFKIVYPFALWLGETGVPGFFFISGYLFFVNTLFFVECNNALCISYHVYGWLPTRN